LEGGLLVERGKGVARGASDFAISIPTRGERGVRRTVRQVAKGIRERRLGKGK